MSGTTNTHHLGGASVPGLALFADKFLGSILRLRTFRFPLVCQFISAHFRDNRRRNVSPAVPLFFSLLIVWC